MQQICPISSKRINEHAARIVAAEVVLLFSIYFITGSWPVLAYLFLDFVIRGFGSARYSIIGLLGRAIAEEFIPRKKIVNAGPKIFAAQIGAFLMLICAIGLYLAEPVITCSAGIVLTFFAFLEASTGFCMACYIYPFIRKKTKEPVMFEI